MDRAPLRGRMVLEGPGENDYPDFSQGMRLRAVWLLLYQRGWVESQEEIYHFSKKCRTPSYDKYDLSEKGRKSD